MDLPFLHPILNSRSIQVVLTSTPLAQLGDFLANFVYTGVRTGIYNQHGSIHVWDNSLRDAMDQAGIRDLLGRKTKPDKVADAAEALVGYAYFTGLMGLEEMMDILSKHLEEHDFQADRREKRACSEAFSHLIIEITNLADAADRFMDLPSRGN